MSERWTLLDSLRENLTEAQWDAVRAALIVLLLVLVGGGGYYFGQPLYRRWQHRQALVQARVFAQAGDYRSMLLSLRRATEMEPNDRSTWEEAANVLGQIGSPEELVARQQLTRIAPQDPGLQIALAREAVRFGRYDTARDALGAVAADSRHRADFARVNVALAMAENRPDAVRAGLDEVVALDPSDTNARFAAAALRLWSQDPAEAARGRAAMDPLLEVEDTQIRAAIELLSAVARLRDGGLMRIELDRCLTVFAPRGQFLLSNSIAQGWEALLAGMQSAAGARASDVALLARWLDQLGHRAIALNWISTLPPPIRRAKPVADFEAQLAAEAGDAAALDQRFREQAWGPWPEQAWKRAIAAHAAGVPPEHKPDPQWQGAIDACSDSLDALRNLGRLAQIWNEPRRAEAAWTAIIDRDPSVTWAFGSLRDSYAGRGDDADLLSLYERWAQHAAQDDTVGAQWVLLACEMNRLNVTVSQRASRLRDDATASLLAKAAVAWRRGRMDEAERLLGRISEAERSTPAVALWNAVVDAELGRKEGAVEALRALQGTPIPHAAQRMLRDAMVKIGHTP